MKSLQKKWKQNAIEASLNNTLTKLEGRSREECIKKILAWKKREDEKNHHTLENYVRDNWRDAAIARLVGLDLAKAAYLSAYADGSRDLLHKLKKIIDIK